VSGVEAFVGVLAKRERAQLAAIDALLDRLDDEPELSAALRLLRRESCELARVARRLTGMVSVDLIYRAFGAPGDWGYESPIGAALYKLYSEPDEESEDAEDRPLGISDGEARELDRLRSEGRL
jgi:hypothetical protein